MITDKFIKKLTQGVAFFLIAVGVSALPINYSSDSGVLISGSAARATTGGGPIVLDGMDPVCHSGGENTGLYIARVLKKVHDGATNPNNGRIAILGSNGTNNSCGSSWATKITQYVSEFTTAPGVDFYTTNTQIETFFASTITSAQPALIWIPDNWSRSSVIEATFTTNAEKIADFVNSGGGLFANMGSYGWLSALLPSATYNNGGCNGGPDATADGIADFALSNSIVAACWHGYFTGNVGTLKTLVDYPYPTASSTRKAVSIGGGSVSLPSSFTLAISPTTPNAGEDLTITATAQTLAGVPQSGVTVTVTVSSGPDAGQTLTATTNASGVATLTVRTNSTGTAVYTATATVNGVAKTVSATVSWNPPTTTTAAPTTSTTSTTSTTTSTAAPSTTTSVAPSTTVAIAPSTTIKVVPSTTVAEAIAPTTSIIETTVPVVAEVTTTTVHDHGTHSHDLPKTGGAFTKSLLLGLSSILFGILTLIYIRRKESKK
jgi:LPXTG-motif cell wall-anchored protein